jgi:hypothetical protein
VRGCWRSSARPYAFILSPRPPLPPLTPQVGDHGVLTVVGEPGTRLALAGVRKGAGGALHVHSVAVEAGELRVGQQVGREGVWKCVCVFGGVGVGARAGKEGGQRVRGG